MDVTRETSTVTGPTERVLPPPAADPRALGRIQCILSNEVVDWLDAQAIAYHRATGEQISRSSLIRALVGAFTGWRLTGFRDEADLKARIVRKLNQPTPPAPSRGEPQGLPARTRPYLQPSAHNGGSR